MRKITVLSKDRISITDIFKSDPPTWLAMVHVQDSREQVTHTEATANCRPSASYINVVARIFKI